MSCLCPFDPEGLPCALRLPEFCADGAGARAGAGAGKGDGAAASGEGVAVVVDVDDDAVGTGSTVGAIGAAVVGVTLEVASLVSC